jgi:hypothetical protein
MCAETAPGDGNDLGMVQETIQSGGSQQGIGKHESNLMLLWIASPHPL